jgi:hypothetical protein
MKLITKQKQVYNAPEFFLACIGFQSSSLTFAHLYASFRLIEQREKNAAKSTIRTFCCNQKLLRIVQIVKQIMIMD